MAEPRSLAAFLREHGGFIRSTLARLGVAARDLPDAHQEVSRVVARRLVAFEPAPDLSPEDAARVWLLRICQRHAKYHHRIENRRAEVLVETDDLDMARSEAPDAEGQLLSAERRAVLLDLLAGLKPRLRSILVAHEVDGTSMEAIAAELAVPVNTAWNGIRLARRDLLLAARRRRLRARDEQ